MGRASNYQAAKKLFYQLHTSNTPMPMKWPKHSTADWLAFYERLCKQEPQQTKKPENKQSPTERVVCECGSVIQSRGMARHIATKKHKTFLNKDSKPKEKKSAVKRPEPERVSVNYKEPVAPLNFFNYVLKEIYDEAHLTFRQKFERMYSKNILSVKIFDSLMVSYNSFAPLIQVIPRERFDKTMSSFRNAFDSLVIGAGDESNNIEREMENLNEIYASKRPASYLASIRRAWNMHDLGIRGYWLDEAKYFRGDLRLMKLYQCLMDEHILFIKHIPLMSEYSYYKKKKYFQNEFIKIFTERQPYVGTPSGISKYYRVLGLQHGATKREVKKAYNKLAIAYHPDKCGDDDPKKFREINEAYEAIKNSITA